MIFKYEFVAVLHCSLHHSPLDGVDHLIRIFRSEPSAFVVVFIPGSPAGSSASHRRSRLSFLRECLIVAQIFLALGSSSLRLVS